MLTTAYILFLQSPSFQTFLAWSQQHIILYSVTLLVLKITAIVYAPLPGGLFTLASIPMLGWKLAYCIDFVGSMIGASMAYFLGKKYGFRFLAKFFDDELLAKLKRIKIHHQREIEGVFILKILTGGSLSDALCYAFGLLHITYRHFLVGSVLAHLVFGIPAFYLSSNILNVRNIFLNLILLTISLGLLYKIRHRYFE